MGDLANANQYLQNPNVNPEEYYQYFQEQKRMLDKQKMSS
jgi:predicted adenine nucleotide alpha hydrolase (AANH) superfamily ATPase